VAGVRARRTTCPHSERPFSPAGLPRGNGEPIGFSGVGRDVTERERIEARLRIYRAIRSKWPALPVLFSSGHADSSKLEITVQSPNLGFLLKPYDFETLRESLVRLTRASRTPDLIAV
jgi:hypothetical protein